MKYFEIVPKSFDGEDVSPIRRAISIAGYCGKYDCILPTKEVGVNDSWRLEHDGKEYRLSKNNELVFRCYDRANIERYLRENVFVQA